MKDEASTADLFGLRERAKELNCLYAVDEALSDQEADLETTMAQLLTVIATGWQYPDRAEIEIDVESRRFSSPGFGGKGPEQRADILVAKRKIGALRVHYNTPCPQADEGPFLKEERRLLDAIAERIGLFLLQRDLRNAHLDWRTRRASGSTESQEWAVIMGFLRRTDQALLARLTRKMINSLCWAGAEEADELLEAFVAREALSEADEDDNRPRRRKRLQDLSPLAERTFSIAARRCSQEELLGNIRTWMIEEKAGYLIDTLEKGRSSLPEIAAALERFQTSDLSENDLPPSLQRSLRVSLIRRFFGDGVSLVKSCKDIVSVDDFHELCQTLICSGQSHGRLGGKGTGLFQAQRILAHAARNEGRPEVPAPRTWYVASDALLDFLRYNNLEDIYDRKYLDTGRIRQDYPQIVQLFKSSRFPPEIRKGLAGAIDDLGDQPLIVRSSSLLEDQEGASFAGKYKSLFLPNQGTRRERLAALLDAVAEVYASAVAPDPIEYRSERGLLDVHEEMAIMIQEVVGTRVGRYFLPAYAGVAFSRSSFRWSPRLTPEDGLLRLVPGLGTRAVDRVSDDYPVLMAPGQPALRVNASPEEVLRYSPRHIDVIDLEEGNFRSMKVDALLREAGNDYPLVRKVISIVEPGRIRAPHGLEPNFERDELVVTFWGLFDDKEFVSQVRWMLDTLTQQLGYPVDLEIACDGKQIYLLQCRSLSGPHEAAPDPIPKDLPKKRVVFTAHRFVSNGHVPALSHLVYVDPDAYAALPSLQKMREVGRAVGRLNKLLPRRRFALVGPGRWGSRGDAKLGVPVTYSDINNTALLVEVAHKRGNYVPELSFGTHFFLDLVEADIRYLPLYPDDEGVVFNPAIFQEAPSIFTDLAPELAEFADVVRVVDLPSNFEGRVLRVMMNGELDEAVGFLSPPPEKDERVDWQLEYALEHPSEHWRWRMRMVEEMARTLEPGRFGVEAIYVVGSTKNQNAGPTSDINLLVHLRDRSQSEALDAWFEGWSRALAEVNYLQTGYRATTLLDVHYVTDEDIEARRGSAAKIGALADPALPLPLAGATLDLE